MTSYIHLMPSGQVVRETIDDDLSSYLCNWLGSDERKVVAKKTFKGHRLDHPVTIELVSPDEERTLLVNCVPSLPGSVFLDLVSVVQFEPGEEGATVTTKDVAQVADAAGILLKVLKMAIVKDEWDAFKAFIDEPDNGVDANMLAEIAGYIAEEYTGGNPPTPLSS